MTTVNATKVSMDMKGSGTFFKRTNIEFKNQVFQGYALKRQKGDTLKALELLKHVVLGFSMTQILSNSNSSE
jgi:hypothetical protein